MFNKYIGKYGKAEAEWVQEVLDMHGGDEEKGREAVIDAIGSIIIKRKDVGEFTPFEVAVEASCFASRDWWWVGLEHLKKIGALNAN